MTDATPGKASAGLPAPPGPAGDATPRPGGQPLAAPLADEVRTGLRLLVVLGLCGVPVGLLWSAVAPRPDLVRRGGGLTYVDLETKDFIAADGLLFLLGAAAGILAALVAWRLARRRPLGALLGLVAGAGLASYVAWRSGVLLEDREALLAAARDPAVAAPAEQPLELRSRAALLGWPGAAALTFALLALRRPQGLPGRPARRPVGADEVSSG